LFTLKALADRLKPAEVKNLIVAIGSFRGRCAIKIFW
jgi:hypothetical protein